jgi:hypothetical protein
MTKAEKRQVLTLGIGGAAALLAVMIGLIAADLPKALASFIGNTTAWTVGITCTVPLLVLLLTNQISALLKTSSDREDIVHDVVTFLPEASTIVHFENSSLAMEYLIQNVPRTKSVFNTRIARKAIEDSIPENVTVIDEFDEVVSKAIENGTNYNWIVSQEYEAAAKALCEKRNQYARSHRSAGLCCFWIVDVGDAPFVHFAILEYQDHSELLLGWAITSVRSYGEKVFLIRDERLVRYYRGLFDVYAQTGREGK